MEKEIVIEDQQPGEEPGLTLRDVLRWVPLLTEIIPMLIAGEGSFITKTPWGRRRVKIERID
jgi:hypothetical protein